MGCGAICGQKALPVEQPTAQQPDAKASMRAQASGLSFMWRGPTAAAVDVRRLKMQEVQTEVQGINKFQSVLPSR